MKRKYIGWAAMVAVLVIVVIVIGYQIDAFGFNGYHTVTIATSHIGTSPATVTRTEVEVPAKSFWDWMQLLIVPVVLAGGGYLFNLTMSRNQQETTTDNQREAALQEYINSMSELLLHENLRESKPEDEVRNVARIRTLTVLQQLDAVRKFSVLLFLHESGLIEKGDRCIVKLDIANLKGADLRGIHLEEAQLWGAKLQGADLSFAYLKGADLKDADLSEANLHKAKYNKKTVQEKNTDGKLVTIEPTRWPVGFDPDARGASCVDC